MIEILKKAKEKYECSQSKEKAKIHFKDYGVYRKFSFLTSDQQGKELTLFNVNVHQSGEIILQNNNNDYDVLNLKYLDKKVNEILKKRLDFLQNYYKDESF